MTRQWQTTFTLYSDVCMDRGGGAANYVIKENMKNGEENEALDNKVVGVLKGLSHNI